MKIPGKQHRLAPTWGRAVWVGATSELCVFSVRLPPFGRGEWKALSAFSRGIHPACGMPEWLASGDLGPATLFWFSGFLVRSLTLSGLTVRLAMRIIGVSQT